MGFTRNGVPMCDFCKYKANCVFIYLDPAARRVWKDMRLAKHFEDGEILYSEGEKPQGLFVVCDGQIKICKTSRGGQQIITRIEKGGDLVGHITLLAGGNYDSTAESMGNARVCLVDQVTFLKFLEAHPKASIALMQALARDVVDGDARASDIAYKSAKNRMADVLLKSVNASYKRLPVVDGIKRRELAEMAGLTVETAVRILAEFERKKLIRRKGKAIVILDQKKLIKIVSASS